MSIILRLKEEKELQLLQFGEKAEERKALAEKLEALDKELGEFDADKAVADIEELTDCAIKLGLIPAPIVEEEVVDENSLTYSQEMGV